jgi:hypothetical protein
MSIMGYLNVSICLKGRAVLASLKSENSEVKPLIVCDVFFMNLVIAK